MSDKEDLMFRLADYLGVKLIGPYGVITNNKFKPVCLAINYDGSTGFLDGFRRTADEFLFGTPSIGKYTDMLMQSIEISKYSNLVKKPVLKNPVFDYSSADELELQLTVRGF